MSSRRIFGVIGLLSLTVLLTPSEAVTQAPPAKAPPPLVVTFEGVFATYNAAEKLVVLLPGDPKPSLSLPSLEPNGIPQHVAVVQLLGKYLGLTGAAGDLMVTLFLGSMELTSPDHLNPATWDLKLSYAAAASGGVTATNYDWIPRLRKAGSPANYAEVDPKFLAAFAYDAVPGLLGRFTLDHKESAAAIRHVVNGTEVSVRTRLIGPGGAPITKDGYTGADMPYANKLVVTKDVAPTALVLERKNKQVTVPLKAVNGQVVMSVRNLATTELAGAHGTSRAYSHARLAYLLVTPKIEAADQWLYFADWTDSVASDPFCNGPVSFQ